MKKDKLSNYTVQERNANKHTARGLGMLDQSMSKDGWIGAITTANDGETFDGSARLETAYERFGEDVEPIIVESDGTRPIIVKRTDIPNAQSEQAKRLSIAANRIAAIDLSWDAEILAEIADEVDLSSMFFEDELEALLSQVEDDDLDYAYQNKEIDTDNLDSSGTFKFTFEYTQYLKLIARFNEYKSEHGITEDDQAFAKLSDA